MAQRRDALGSLELPGWKATLNWIAAVLTAMVFIVSGLWKITDPIGAAARLAHARLPESISLPATIVLGIEETVAAVLVLVPRFRRWGAWLASDTSRAKSPLRFSIHYHAPPAIPQA